MSVEPSRWPLLGEEVTGEFRSESVQRDLKHGAACPQQASCHCESGVQGLLTNRGVVPQRSAKVRYLPFLKFVRGCLQTRCERIGRAIDH